MMKLTYELAHLFEYPINLCGDDKGTVTYDEYESWVEETLDDEFYTWYVHHVSVDDGRPLVCMHRHEVINEAIA